MTLIISALTSSGIVLSADSRQTYRNNVGVVRIGSDSAMKLFKLTERCGVAIAGRAFINEDKQPMKDVGYFIKRFLRTEKDVEKLSVKETAAKLGKYIGSIFIPRELESAKPYIENEVKSKGGSKLTFGAPTGNALPYSYVDKDGKTVSLQWWIESITMIVAGVDSDEVGRAYLFVVPNDITLESNTKDCGAIWGGQTDVLTRIIKGHAPEAGNLEFLKEALKKNEKETKEEINGLEYIINWGTITLQDAIDFCVLMTRTTQKPVTVTPAQRPATVTPGQKSPAVITEKHTDLTAINARENSAKPDSTQWKMEAPNPWPKPKDEK